MIVQVKFLYNGKVLGFPVSSWQEYCERYCEGYRIKDLIQEYYDTPYARIGGYITHILEEARKPVWKDLFKNEFERYREYDGKVYVKGYYRGWWLRMFFCVEFSVFARVVHTYIRDKKLLFPILLEQELRLDVEEVIRHYNEVAV